MARIGTGMIALALIGAGAFYVLTDPRVVSPMPPLEGVRPVLANGERLFHAGGCASCHAAPGSADKTRLAGGLKLGSPFGTFVTPNISPHPVDGIGAWSVTDFVRAMATGVAPDGSHYYPAFPYTSYWRMNWQDLADLFGYLRTLPAVEGRAPGHDLSAPFGWRRLVGGWKLLFFARSPLRGEPAFAPDPSRSAAWNRGRYLVEGPGHCAECHSPRNAFGAIDESRRLAGGSDPEGRGFVPNITPHATGIGKWTKAEIVELLTNGFTPDFDVVGSTMSAVVANMARLPAEDREAMAEYLLSLAPIDSPRPKRGG